jgi:hypothetical protein
MESPHFSIFNMAGENISTDTNWGPFLVLDRTGDGALSCRKISNTPGAGWGIFAATNIPKGTIILEYDAKWKQARSCPWHEYSVHHLGWVARGSPEPPLEARGSLVNDRRPGPERNVDLIITGNHGELDSNGVSIEPHPSILDTKRPIPRLWWIAFKDIYAGQELLGDYGKAYWVSWREANDSSLYADIQ